MTLAAVTIVWGDKEWEVPVLVGPVVRTHKLPLTYESSDSTVLAASDMKLEEALVDPVLSIVDAKDKKWSSWIPTEVLCKDTV